MLLGREDPDATTVSIRSGRREDDLVFLRVQGRSPSLFTTRALSGSLVESGSDEAVEIVASLDRGGAFDVRLPRVPAGDGRWLVARASESGVAAWVDRDEFVQVQLLPLASVQGSATGLAGRRGFSVCAVSEFGEVRSAPIDPVRGTYVLTGLIPGKWQLAVMCGDEAQESVNVVESQGRSARGLAHEIDLVGGERRVVVLDSGLTASNHSIDLRTPWELDWSARPVERPRDIAVTCRSDGPSRFDFAVLADPSRKWRTEWSFEARSAGLRLDIAVSSASDGVQRIDLPGALGELRFVLPESLIPANDWDLELTLSGSLESGGRLTARGTPLGSWESWSAWVWDGADVELEQRTTGAIWKGRVHADPARGTARVEWD